MKRDHHVCRMSHRGVYHLQHDPILNTGLKKDIKLKMTLRSPKAGVVVERFGDKRKYLYRIIAFLYANIIAEARSSHKFMCFREPLLHKGGMLRCQ